MADFTTEEGTHTTDDGQSLYTKTWKPAGPVKAYLVFVHGFSDHCNRYDSLFPPLVSRGIEVRSWDQRSAELLRSREHSLNILQRMGTIRQVSVGKRSDGPDFPRYGRHHLLPADHHP